MRDRLRQILNVVAAVFQLVTAGLGGAGINGASVEVISNKYLTFFTPATYTFAVWGPIYLGLTAYAIYQALPGQQSRTIHRRVGWWAIAAAMFNGVWVLFFIFDLITISMVLILGLLVSVIAIFVVLRDMRGQFTMADRWAVQIPFSGYFAWVTVATVANAVVNFMALGLGAEVVGDVVQPAPLWGVGGDVWSATLLGIAALIATLMITYSGGSAGIMAYLGVLVWAFVGVYFGNVEKSQIVGIMALAMTAVVVLVTVARLVRPAPVPEENTRKMATA